MGRGWGLAFAVAFAVLGLFPAVAAAADFRTIVADHANSDFDSDGTREIESLGLLFGDERELATPSDMKLVVVLVEERLLSPLSGSGYTVAELQGRLDRFRADLKAQGYVAKMVVTRVYSGNGHQDGKTVLALRRFLKSTRASYPGLAGAILIGDFPDAMLVRSVLWKKSDDRLTVKPEVLARRSDLVLADLDGQWEAIYHEQAQELVTWNAVALTPDPNNPGPWPCNGCVVRSTDYVFDTYPFQDFFYIQDDRHSTLDASGVLTVSMTEVKAGPELALGDRYLPNPIAQPEIIVSRINPRRVAVEPPANFLDANGHPQAVQTTLPPSWARSAALERQMLIEYFDRNHTYRSGLTPVLRTAATTFPESDFSVNTTKNFLQQAADPSFAAPLTLSDGSLLQFTTWLTQSAALKGIHAHADRKATWFGGEYDVAQLEQVAGPHLWHWVRENDRYVPSLAGLGPIASDELFYTLWRNQTLGSRGVFYIHNGCDVNSPENAETRPYNHPDYGVRQNGEGYLFYLNGVALLARSKDFYDSPWGFTAALRESPETPFGQGWLAQFQEAAQDAELSQEVVGRKRSYTWGLLGDWTMTLHPPRVDSNVVAFDGVNFTDRLMRLGMGTHVRGDFAWAPESIGSFVMPQGLELRMFNKPNGVGRYATVRGDLPSVGTYYYDNYIGSVEVRSRTTHAATLFSETGYSGTSARIPPGHYTFTQLQGTFGINPKSVSSIQLNDVDVFIYDRQTWWNDWRAFASSVSNLGTYGWNDRLESIVVLPKNHYITAYQSEGYQGAHVLLEPGRYDTADLQSLGLNGWAISSVYVGSAVRVRAYSQPGFQGQPLILDGSIGDLGPLGWNNVIVSMIVEER
ncbi:MAG: hypothetical protein JXB05_30015 [Myxococcaceae bacterium]|nr:hypothetical protein [Myxococcaceae bacterium]